MIKNSIVIKKIDWGEHDDITLDITDHPTYNHKQDLYGKKKKWITCVTFCYCTCYAALDEIHQLFVPNRSGQVRDVLIDSVGILIGIILFRTIYGVTHSSDI